MSTHPQFRVNVITLALSALLGVAVLAGCTGGGSLQPAPAPTGQATESAPTLVDAAAGAVLSAGSVHINWVQTGPSSSLTESVDVTASGGRDVVTANETDHATILFIDGVAYVEADQPGLEAIFNLSAYVAEEFWDEWIAVRSGEKLGSLSYDDLTEGMTLSSVADVVQVCGACTLTAPTTVAGQRALSVQAPAPADDHAPASARFVLYMTDNSQPKPMLLELRGDGNITNRISFSGWHETLHLSAPTDTISAQLVTIAESVT
jgi:hypothetical protein